MSKTVNELASEPFRSTADTRDSMSRLGSITNNHLALECSLCGHTAQVAVVDLIAALGRECSVQDAARKARCSRCHAKGHATFRIIFIGGSGDAMLGSRPG